MIQKTPIICLFFTIIIVPGHLYCVNHPNGCPQHQEVAHNCDHCRTPLLPMIESRMSDQKPYKHQNEDDESEEVEDFSPPTIPVDFFDKSEESLAAQFTKQKNIDISVLNIGDKVKTFEDFANLSSEELVLGNSSKKSWQSNTIVKPKFLPDVLATPEKHVGRSKTTESVLDVPPYIPDAMEREMSGLPVEAEDMGNVEIDETLNTVPKVVFAEVTSTPKESDDSIKIKKLNEAPAVVSKETQANSGSIKKEGEERATKVKSKKAARRKSNRNGSNPKEDEANRGEKTEEKIGEK